MDTSGKIMTDRPDSYNRCCVPVILLKSLFFIDNFSVELFYMTVSSLFKHLVGCIDV